MNQKGRKKSTLPIKTETITVRLTTEEKENLKEVADKLRIPYSKLVGSLVDGEKKLFISYTKNKSETIEETENSFKIADSVEDAIRKLEFIKTNGGEITFLGWIVKIKKGKFKPFEKYF